MIKIPAEIQKNPRFSGHETFPLRQLWLKKAHDAVSASKNTASKAVFTDADAIQRFGVGKNMVSAIRHWGLACDVLREGKGGELSVGAVGKFLFEEPGVDPFLESPASAWLIHWLLAGRATRSTTWFWVFNYITHQTFDRKMIADAILEFARENNLRLSPTTVQRDLEVCIRCYLPPMDSDEGEEVIEPLLSDLGLLGQGAKGVFEFRRGAKPTLPDGVFIFALLEFWRRWETETGSTQSTLSFDVIAHDYGAPGRVFKLDENAVAERVLALEDLTRGMLKWSDSAGVRQVSRDPRMLDEDAMQTVLVSAYE